MSEAVFSIDGKMTRVDLPEGKAACVHKPAYTGKAYDGFETHCLECGCRLRVSAPGQGKRNKSKKQRRFEKKVNARIAERNKVLGLSPSFTDGEEHV